MALCFLAIRSSGPPAAASFPVCNGNQVALAVLEGAPRRPLRSDRRTELQPPANRPKVFYRGNNVLDPVKVGFNSNGPDGFLYDTSLAGNGNGGHLYGTQLPDAEKWAQRQAQADSAAAGAAGGGPGLVMSTPTT